MVSVPDKRRGERIVLVTTAADAEAGRVARSQARRRALAELMVPADIVKVDAMPMLGSGKTDYLGARRVAMEMLGLDAAA